MGRTAALWITAFPLGLSILHMTHLASGLNRAEVPEIPCYRRLQPLGSNGSVILGYSVIFFSLIAGIYRTERCFKEAIMHF